MHERFSESVDSMVSSVRDEVYASVRERASMEGGVGISAPLVETFFFTGKELVPEGKLYELVGRGSTGRRSLFACKDIKKGEVFTLDNVRSVRPAAGLHPKYLNHDPNKKEYRLDFLMLRQYESKHLHHFRFF